MSRDIPADTSKEGIFGHAAQRQLMDFRGSTHAEGRLISI